MKIKEIKQRIGIKQHKELNASYAQFNNLLTELRQKELSHQTIGIINDGIDKINSTHATDKEWKKETKNTQMLILKHIEKEHKLVIKNHYRNIWLAVGMASFGIPVGVVLGTSLNNMAFIGLGIPIGIGIGIAVGAGLDKRAFQDGRQIDWEMKF